MGFGDLLRRQRSHLRCERGRCKRGEGQGQCAANDMPHAKARHFSITTMATGVRLFVFVAEVCAHDTCLQVFKRAKVLNDVAAGVIEEQFAILRTPDSDNPFEIVAVFEQIIDGLGNATAWDDRDFWTR
jgi:hypothetical protein